MNRSNNSNINANTTTWVFTLKDGRAPKKHHSPLFLTSSKTTKKENHQEQQHKISRVLINNKMS